MLDAVERSWTASSKNRAVTRPDLSSTNVPGWGDAIESAHHLSPFLGRPRRVHFLIQEAVGADGGRARVGQERNLDAVGAGEPREGRDRVVGDDGDAEPLVLEVPIAALQLDELRLAERSPVGRAAEHQHQPVRPHQRRQVPACTRLVDEREVRRNVADLGSERYGLCVSHRFTSPRSRSQRYPGASAFIMDAPVRAFLPVTPLPGLRVERRQVPGLEPSAQGHRRMAGDAFDYITGNGEFADGDGAVARHPPLDLERRHIEVGA